MSVIVDTHELAWAAGFFDGEGNVRCQKYCQGNSNFLQISIGQIDPVPLERFRKAVWNVGRVNGPYANGTHNPVWRYQVTGFEECQAVIAALWKYLSKPKRVQAINAFKKYNVTGYVTTYRRGSDIRYRRSFAPITERMLAAREIAKHYTFPIEVI